MVYVTMAVNELRGTTENGGKNIHTVLTPTGTGKLKRNITNFVAPHKKEKHI